MKMKGLLLGTGFPKRPHNRFTAVSPGLKKKKQTESFPQMWMNFGYLTQTTTDPWFCIRKWPRLRQVRKEEGKMITVFSKNKTVSNRNCTYGTTKG